MSDFTDNENGSETTEQTSERIVEITKEIELKKEHIAELEKEAENLKIDLKKEEAEIASAKTNAIADLKEIQSMLVNANSINQQLEDTFADVKVKTEVFEQKVQEVERELSEFNKLDDDGETKMDKLRQNFAESDANSKVIDKVHKNIVRLNEDVFGTDENPDGLKRKLNGFYEEQSEVAQSWNRKFTDLKEQIEELMPGATSAGLASGYRKQGRSYGWEIWSSQIVFIAVLGLAIWFGIDSLPETFDKTNEVLSRFFLRLPVFAGFVWMAAMLYRNQSQMKRMREEYRHKESYANTYQGYVNQVESLPESEKSHEIRLRLLDEMVNMAAKNPSETLSHQSHNRGAPNAFGMIKEESREENKEQ